MGHSLYSREFRILDIGGSQLQESLRDMLQGRMLTPGKQCVLPSALLSDDRGLGLWHQINRLPTYYQTNEEINLLELHGSEIAEQIPSGATLIDLGCGDIRKVCPLLDKLNATKKHVTYYGLDLSKSSLERGLSQLLNKYEFIDCWGLWGTFDDALAWCQQVPSPRCFLSLGSILGNDFMDTATSILSKWAAIMRPNDRMLLGMDATTDKDKIWQSYHDSDGLFTKFMRGGLEHSNRILGEQWYRPEDWTVEGVWTERPLMHRFVFKSLRDVNCPQIPLFFPEAHEINCYEAFKYEPKSMVLQFARSGLQELGRWNAPGSSIYEYLLSSTHDSNDTVVSN